MEMRTYKYEIMELAHIITHKHTRDMYIIQNINKFDSGCIIPVAQPVLFAANDLDPLPDPRPFLRCRNGTQTGT